MPRTEIVHEDATLRLGVSRNLLVFAWSGTPESEHIRTLSRVHHTLAGRYHEHLAALDLVVTGTPRFTDPLRDELVRLVRDPRLQGKGTAHVVSMGGLTGATVRAFISTVILLARPAAPNKVFSEVAPAAAWLVPMLTTGGEAWNTAGVLSVVADVTGKVAATAR